MAAKNAHRFEFRMGRLGLVLFVLGMSALLFSVFLFGIDVGKNIDTYPDKIAGYIPDRIRNRAGWTMGASKTVADRREEKKPETAGADKDMDLTFYNTLAKKQGDAGGLIVESPGEKKIDAGTTVEKTPPAPKPKSRTVLTEQASAVTPQKPAAAPQAPVPAAVQKKETAPAKEKFLIQLVSYQQKSKADELAGRLKSMGYAPRIEVTNLPDKGKWFRVIMNGFQSREDAQKAADRVSKNVKGLNCVIRSSESSGNP